MRKREVVGSISGADTTAAVYPVRLPDDADVQVQIRVVHLSRHTWTGMSQHTSENDQSYLRLTLVDWSCVLQNMTSLFHRPGQSICGLLMLRSNTSELPTKLHTHTVDATSRTETHVRRIESSCRRTAAFFGAFTAFKRSQMHGIQLLTDSRHSLVHKHAASSCQTYTGIFSLSGSD